MSTRGTFGFKKGKTVKVFYNNSDSYPTGLGLDVIDFIKNTTDENLLLFYKNCKLVKRGTLDTPISFDNSVEWLTKNSSDRVFIESSKKFMNTAWFCEWSYTIDVTRNVLEVKCDTAINVFAISDIRKLSRTYWEMDFARLYRDRTSYVRSLNYDSVLEILEGN